MIFGNFKEMKQVKIFFGEMAIFGKIQCLPVTSLFPSLSLALSISEFAHVLILSSLQI